MPIIDRRLADKNKSLGNRKKYLDRVHDELKDSVKESIRSKNIKDLLSKDNRKIVIPGKGLREPTFTFKPKSGNVYNVIPGNNKFNVGDKIPKEKVDGDSQPDKNGPDDESGYAFELTKKEFMDIFFEDMELPDIVRKQIPDAYDEALRRAGHSKTGSPNKLNVLRTMKQAAGRKFALAMTHKKMLQRLQAELNELLLFDESTLTDDQKQQIELLDREIANVTHKLKCIPFINDTDLRYNHWEINRFPITQAVMFAVMDVSGSMGEWEREMAKRYYLLLVLFLEHNYEKVDIVFIQHTTTAKEVTEEEFFYNTSSGGTQISSALELVKNIIEERFPTNKWNIFVAQISDGDNLESDNATAETILHKLIPLTQYYTYVEIKQAHGSVTSSTDLGPVYEKLESTYKNLKKSIITHVSDIYPVFRKLFEKK